ncbi:MAG TPA: hypothetical protein VLX32_10380 [Candidatus Acidoferrum sp.]|nr:hypothetical protein [Candidatus Acidoferrum sp.]
MIAVYACSGLAVLLLILLFFVGDGRETDEDKLLYAEHDLRSEVLSPPEIVHRIFSRQDRRFIRDFDSPRLRRIYSKERKQIARDWIRQTSRGIRKIMRDHLRSARASQNLELSGEISLLGHYVQLRCLCGLLALSSLLVSPGVLQEVALYACNLSHRMKSAHHRLEATFQIPSPESTAGVSR